MGVGTDDGTYYADEREYHADQAKKLSDAAEMKANDTSGDFISRFGGAEQRPLVYITNPRGNVEDRTNDSVAKTAVHYIADSLNPSSLADLGTAYTSKNYFGDLGMAATSRMPQVETPMSDDLGYKSIPQYQQPVDKTVTDADIEKGMSLGMAFSGGGLSMGGVKSLGGKLQIEGDKFVSSQFPEAAEKANNLSVANDMAQAGHGAQDIWDKTGWFQGADNKWKFEIPNSEARLNTDNLDPHLTLNGAGYKLPDMTLSQAGQIYAGKARSPNTLGDILDHPELYKYYPQLKDTQVITTNGFERLQGIQGWYSPEKGLMALGPGTEEHLLSTILHEAQHGIQYHEGFSSGSSTQALKSDNWMDMEKTFNTTTRAIESKVREVMPDKNPYLVRRAIQMEDKIPQLEKALADNPKGWSVYDKKELDELKQYVQEAKDKGVYEGLKFINKGEDIKNRYDDLLFQHYRRVKGEVEARNVQTRLKDMDYIQHPAMTEDVPRSEQIASPRD